MNARRLYLVQRTRKSLDTYLERFELELDAESCPRHLESVAMVCTLLLDRLEELTGRTVETVAYTRRMGILTRRGVEMWTPLPESPAPGVAKAKPRLRLVPSTPPAPVKGSADGEVTP